MKNKRIQLILCAVIAAILALTAHIYISDFTSPIIQKMMEPVGPVSTNNYSYVVIYSAYITAFITTFFMVFVYYYTQHLIPGKTRFIRLSFTIIFLFCIKGNDLIRQPIMDLIFNYSIGMKAPLLFIIIGNIDKWVANILLAACIVYLCPKRSLI